MFRKIYLTLCGLCLAVKITWVLLPFLGEIHRCRYSSLLLSEVCHGLMTYLVMSIIFFYIDPLLLLVTLIWFIRSVGRMEKYPKENIFMVFSWLITISDFLYLVLIG